MESGEAPFEVINHGKVIGIDIEIRPRNRKAIEAHPMAKRITLVEGTRDGVMNLVHDVPRGTPSWTLDNPTEAAREFAEKNPNVILEQPKWLFNESELSQNVTTGPARG